MTLVRILTLTDKYIRCELAADEDILARSILDYDALSFRMAFILISLIKPSNFLSLLSLCLYVQI